MKPIPMASEVTEVKFKGLGQIIMLLYFRPELLKNSKMYTLEELEMVNPLSLNIMGLEIILKVKVKVLSYNSYFLKQELFEHCKSLFLFVKVCFYL